MVRDFSINDLIVMIKKLSRHSTARARSKLSCVRSQNEESGCVSIANQDKKMEKVNLVGVPIEIEMVIRGIELLILTNKSWSIASIIWVELMQLLNKSNDMMRKFLEDMYRVNNFHSMLQHFKNVSTTEEIVELLEIMFSRDASSGNDNIGEVSEEEVRDQSKSDVREPHRHHELAMVHRSRLFCNLVVEEGIKLLAGAISSPSELSYDSMGVSITERPSTAIEENDTGYLEQ